MSFSTVGVIAGACHVVLLGSFEKPSRFALEASDASVQKRQGSVHAHDTLGIVEGLRQRVRQRSLSNAWEIFNQEVATCEKAGEAESELRRLAHDYSFERLDDGLNQDGGVG